MDQKKGSNKKLIISAIVLVAAIVLMAGMYTVALPKGTVGAKTVKVEVVYKDGTSDIFTIMTNEEFLRGALEQEGLIEGTEDSYGIYITAVNGVTADYEKDQSWWCITKSGEMVTTGADTTVITDGDEYEITYTIR